MRLALVIDGNASGAKQAADEVARALAAAKQSTSSFGAAAGQVFKGFESDLAKAASEINAIELAVQRFAADMTKAVGSVNDLSGVGQQGLNQIRAKYDPLFAAGQQYKQQLGDIRDAVHAGALTQGQGELAIQRTKQAFTQQVAAINQTGAGFKNLSFEAKNLSFQLIDVTQGVFMGQSAFMIMAQQGGQLAQIIAFSPGGLGGLMKQLGGAIGALITPTRLLAVGAAAAGVAGYAMYQSWKSAEMQFDETARSAGVTIARLHELESAASFKGISQSDFLGAMDQFAAKVYQAQNGMGGLGEVMRANGVQAKTFNDYLAGAAEVIKNATTYQQKRQLLEQMGLPVTSQWVRFLSQGSDGIKKATDEAVKWGGAANDNMVAKSRAFDETWDRSWKNFSDNAKGAATDAGSWLDWLSDKGTALLMKLPVVGAAVPKNILQDALTGGMRGTSLTPADASSFYDRFGSRFQEPPGTKKSADPNTNKADISRQMQSLSLLGQTTTALEARRMVELQVQQAAAAGVHIDARRVEVLKRLAEENTLGITQIRAGTDAYRLEAETVGMGVGQASAYLAAQNAILEAKRRGTDLTAENIAAIQREANALGEAAQRADNLKAGYDVAKGSVSTFKNELMQGATFFDALGKAGVNALSRIIDKLIEVQLNSVWQSIVGNVIGSVVGAPLALGNAAAGGGVGSVSAGTVGGTGIPGIGALYDKGGYTGNRARTAVAGLVHGQEFVVNAAATSRHLPLLKAINDNRLPGYERGGLVGGSADIPPPPRMVVNGGWTFAPVVNLNVKTSGNAEVQAGQARQNESGGFDLELFVDMVDQGMAQRQIDGTGHTARVLKTDFGITRKF